jgi:hypothetical protein
MLKAFKGLRLSMLSILASRLSMGEAARGYRWKTAEPGDRIALKHGCWATDVPDLAREIVSELFAADLVERHPMIAIRAAETWIRLRRAEADIAQRGEVIDGREHPLLGRMATWDNFLLSVAREYGATPRSEAQLVTAAASAQRDIVDLDSVRERGRKAIEAREAQQ